MMIRQLWMMCAALTVGLAAVPSTAQQMAVDQGMAAPPSSAEVPPPPPVPPPLPPMPSSRHRWVSIGSHAGGHHSTGHHSTARHSIRHHAAARHSRAHHRATRHSRGRHHEPALSPAAKAMRWCAKLSPHAMMRHSACKAMVHAYRADASSDRRHRHNARHKARSKHHRKASRRHHSRP